MLISELISQVSVQLIDTGSTRRWEQAELLDYYNNGTKQIVAVKPGANPTTESVQMSSSVKQALPSGATGLLKITRNMGTDGSTPGRAVIITDKEIMDQTAPTWATDTATEAIIHYMYDKDIPLQYYVYPQSDGNGYIEMTYGKSPSDVAISDIGTTDVQLTDDYVLSLKDYILWQAFVKDSDNPDSARRAKTHEDTFKQSVGAAIGSDAMTDPNIQATSPKRIK